MNVFLIESPLQLLNAIEAKHFFEFVDNHLIVLLGGGFQLGSFKALIDERDWASVRYVTMHEKRHAFQSHWLGTMLAQQIANKWNTYAQYSNRRLLDKLASSLASADSLILGHYDEAGKKHMRHFANALKHKRLYLVDDGTDVIRVNSDRLRNRTHTLSCKGRHHHAFGWKKVKQKLRAAFVDWNDLEAEEVVFFTCYDLEARKGDRVVKNEYRHLRKGFVEARPSDQVLFLGQTWIEDDFVDSDTYLEYLRKVRTYFSGEDVIYVPHPRESRENITRVRSMVGFRIEKPDVPIECHIGLSGVRPKILASFCCAALVNCSIIFDSQLRIVAFHIDSADILRDSDFIEDVYGEFGKWVSGNIELVRL